MNSSATHAPLWQSPWLILPFIGLLFILPFPGTVAGRLLLLVMAVVVAAMGWRRGEVPAVPCTSAFALWAAVMLLSLTYAVDSGYSASEIKNELGYTMLAAMAFFVYINSEKKLRWACCSAMAVMAILSVWAIALYIQYGYWFEAAGHGGSGVFSSYVLMVVSILIVAWQQFKGKGRWVIVLVAALALAAAAGARQRAFWPVLGVELLIVLWFESRRALIFKNADSSAWVRKLVYGALLAVSLAVMFATTQVNRLTVQGGAVQFENDDRLRKWPDVMESILEHPLTGAGFGRNAMKLGHAHLITADAPQFWHAHNLFLNYGLAMGLPGMLALIGLFASLAWVYWRLTRSTLDPVRAIGVAGLVLIASVVLRNMSNDFFQRDVAIFFWAVNGMFLGIAARMERVQRASAA